LFYNITLRHWNNRSPFIELHHKKNVRVVLHDKRKQARENSFVTTDCTPVAR